MSQQSWNAALDAAQAALRLRLMHDAADAIEHLREQPSALFSHPLDDGCELIVHSKDGDVWGEYEGRAPVELVNLLLEEWQSEKALDAAICRDGGEL